MIVNKNIYNFLTFDIEEWFHANFSGVDFKDYSGLSTNLEENVDRLIDVCADKGVYSTCFILGSVAKKKPQIVKKLHKAGHEIASHGFDHKLVYNMTRDKFKDDLKRSCDVLEDITGEKVLGFRAPCWSIKKENFPWYYSVLEEAGLRYSSSVYPAHTFLYGIPDFPKKVHYPKVDGKVTKILEIPVPVMNLFGKDLGFSGGFYLRLLPTWFIKQVMRNRNQKGEPIFIYLHPREIDIKQPKLKLPLLENFIYYWGIGFCEKKLRQVIKPFSKNIIRIKDFLNKNAQKKIKSRGITHGF